MNSTRTTLIAVALAALAVVPSTGCRSGAQADTPPTPIQANHDQPDRSVAPGVEQDAQTPEGARSAPFNIRSNTIRTRHIMDGTVTSGKIAYTAVTVNVSAAASTGSSAADPTLVGGFLVSCDPSGNEDQVMDNAVLNGDGSVTVTLGAAATAQNNFRCVVVKANSKGVS
jgi:hypothetical protein